METFLSIWTLVGLLVVWLSWLNSNKTFKEIEVMMEKLSTGQFLFLVFLAGPAFWLYVGLGYILILFVCIVMALWSKLWSLLGKV